MLFDVSPELDFFHFPPINIFSDLYLDRKLVIVNCEKNYSFYVINVIIYVIFFTVNISHLN